MSELVQKAQDFATQAHKRIDHRRKYTRQPYEVHLKAVAQLVREVGGDEQMIATAWLHDTVEDTAATHRDIEQAFGAQVARYVYELTDISKPSDGNRATRKTLDRDHLARASAEAKTIKLADLIDNTRDICKHDPGFSRIFVSEVQALLDVLKEGDSKLYQRAQKEVCRCADRLGIDQPPGSALLHIEPTSVASADFSQRRVLRLFTESFTAIDIAEPLRSFDINQPASEIIKILDHLELDVVGVRHDGIVAGFAWRSDLSTGRLGEWARGFSRDQIVRGDATLSDVILVLTRHDHCFISALDGVAGVATREDMEKPIVRMWLFGMITMIEIKLVSRIRELWPNGSWQELCPKARLNKAEVLYEERKRRNQHADLLDCLQLSDKARLFIHTPEHLEEIGFNSRRAAQQTISSIESLRNNLAHGQPISTYDWPQIIRMTQRIEDLILNW